MAVEEARGRQLGAGRLSNPTVWLDFNNETYLSPGEVMFSLDQSFPITKRLRLEKQLTAQLVTAAELEVRDAERRLIAEAQTLAVQIHRHRAAEEFAPAADGAGHEAIRVRHWTCQGR